MASHLLFETPIPEKAPQLGELGLRMPLWDSFIFKLQKVPIIKVNWTKGSISPFIYPSGFGSTRGLLDELISPSQLIYWSTAPWRYNATDIDWNF